MKLPLFILATVITFVAAVKIIKRRLRYTGRAHTLFSKILNEERSIWVHIPQAGSSDSKQHYPVVYLLDAEDHFKFFTAMLDKIDPATGEKIFPEVMVIGIPNTRRVRDLTPTSSMTNALGKKDAYFRSAGGGKNFIAFIETELIPFVNANYPVSTSRIIMGHSLGGLTVVDILLNKADLFDGYIVSDPSMWWDNRVILKGATQVLKSLNLTGKKLYLGIANTMPPGFEKAQIITSTVPKSNHMRSTLELANVLEGTQYSGLIFSYKYYQTHNHDTVPVITAYDGLRFLLTGQFTE